MTSRILYSTPLFLAPLRLWLAAIVVCLAGGAGLNNSAHAQSPQEALLADYQRIQPQLLNNPFGVPVYVQSRNHDAVAMAEIYGQVAYRLPQIEAALAEPAGWCELLALPLNVKACTHSERNQPQSLTLYMGRKFYQAPDQATPVAYQFQFTASTPDYFEVSLAAADGPLGTRDHRIALQAIALPTGTLIHIRVAYRYSAASQWATSLYLSTLGRGKIGFSTNGVDRTGQPEYVQGVRGALERNSMRYYLALQATLETGDLPKSEQFEARIQRWYALTERYRAQLYELDQEEYLQAKRQERRNQLQLQNLLTAQASNH